jgi:hypothetical protein
MHVKQSRRHMSLPLPALKQRKSAKPQEARALLTPHTRSCVIGPRHHYRLARTLHSTTTSNMFAARTAFRAAPRQALARAPARAGRRNYSSESPKQFAGAEDNEFNRERARIAEHGGESGEFWRKLSL